jgi:AraC family transcriptional regulator, arabinose operon regulatory protein
MLAYEILLELGQSGMKTHIPLEVARALSYMSSNINRNMSLEEIAQASGVSMFHFSRMFQKSMQHSPMSFFFQQKMTLAQTLLKNTELLIKEIAVFLGYDDPFYFSARFRKFTGHSPREYRRQIEKGI